MNSSKNSLKEIARNIKAVAFDGDGVLFSGTVLIGKNSEGKYEEFGKERSHIDGQGMSLLRAAGIRIAFVSAERGFVDYVGDKLNSLSSVKNGKYAKIDVFGGVIGSGKVLSLEGWLKELGVSWGECAYMGDDVGDYEVMKKVGLSVAPAQAEEVIKDIASFVTVRQGGNGAIRDLCNYILEAKGIDPLSLALR